jgi:hypothetical protein
MIMEGTGPSAQLKEKRTECYQHPTRDSEQTQNGKIHSLRSRVVRIAVTTGTRIGCIGKGEKNHDARENQYLAI